MNVHQLAQAVMLRARGLGSQQPVTVTVDQGVDRLRLTCGPRDAYVDAYTLIEATDIEGRAKVVDQLARELTDSVGR